MKKKDETPEVEEVLPVEEQTAPADELSQTQDKLLRLMAEYDNFRKRTTRERETVYGMVKGDTAARFLPILDNLERAASTPTSDAAYAQGIEMIARQFNELLEKLGVTEIDALGKPFDSELHAAVMHEENEGGESVVAEVFQKGYTMDGRVLRHSTVKTTN